MSEYIKYIDREIRSLQVERGRLMASNLSSSNGSNQTYVAFSREEWKGRIQPIDDYVNQNIQTLSLFAGAKEGEYVLINKKKDSRASICFSPRGWMTLSIDGSTPIEVKDIEDLKSQLISRGFIEYNTDTQKYSAWFKRLWHDEENYTLIDRVTAQRMPCFQVQGTPMFVGVRAENDGLFFYLSSDINAGTSESSCIFFFTVKLISMVDDELMSRAVDRLVVELKKHLIDNKQYSLGFSDTFYHGRIEFKDSIFFKLNFGRKSLGNVEWKTYSGACPVSTRIFLASCCSGESKLAVSGTMGMLTFSCTDPVFKFSATLEDSIWESIHLSLISNPEERRKEAVFFALMMLDKSIFRIEEGKSSYTNECMWVIKRNNLPDKELSLYLAPQGGDGKFIECSKPMHEESGRYVDEYLNSIFERLDTATGHAVRSLMQAFANRVSAYYDELYPE